jgi:hypothetical protein
MSTVTEGPTYNYNVAPTRRGNRDPGCRRNSYSARAVEHLTTGLAAGEHRPAVDPFWLLRPRCGRYASGVSANHRLVAVRAAINQPDVFMTFFA